MLDVDGVLAVVPGGRPQGELEHRLVIDATGTAHTVWLVKEHTQMLIRLANDFQLVWATGWEHDAPRLLEPLLGCPSMPVVEFTQRPAIGIALEKLPDVAIYVGSRPVAWVDDELSHEEEAWAAQRGVPTLLIRPNPSIGLTDVHVDELIGFARSVTAGAVDEPVVYLLAGLPCSGKTAYARRLEASGVVRISVDDMMLAEHGRLGIDYPVADHERRLVTAVGAVRSQLVEEVKSGRSVVLDHGLGRRSERDEYKALVERLGAQWQLVHFAVDIETLRSRCSQRLDDPDSVPVTDQMLMHLAEMWEPPAGEDATVVDQTGRARR